MTPAKLELYAFYWLMALLSFSAAAMLLGARPLVFVIFGHSSSSIYSLLDLSWIISGVAATYLTYQWVKNDKKIFGGDEKKDLVAFLIMMLCGFNVGLDGLIGTNVVLNVSMSFAYLLILGALCIASGYHLWTRWNANGQQLFSTGSSASVADVSTEGKSEANDENTEVKPTVDGMREGGGEESKENNN